MPNSPVQDTLELTATPGILHCLLGVHRLFRKPQNTEQSQQYCLTVCERLEHKLVRRIALCSQIVAVGHPDFLYVVRTQVYENTEAESVVCYKLCSGVDLLECYFWQCITK